MGVGNKTKHDLSGTGGAPRMVPRDPSSPAGERTERVGLYLNPDQVADRAAELAALGYVTPRQLRPDQQGRLRSLGRRLLGSGLRSHSRSRGVL